MTLRSRKSRLALRSLAAAAFAAAVAGAGLRFDALAGWAAHTAVDLQERFALRVAEIAVSGRKHTPQAELDRAIGPVTGRPLSRVDIDAIRQRLEAISWVKRADVARRLPDRIEIRLEERTPFALWQKAGALTLIDAEGVVLTRDRLARWRDLPLIAGEGAPEAAPALLALFEAEPTLAESVAASRRVGGRRWDLELKGGMTVRLPERGRDPAYGPSEAWSRLAALERRHRLLARAITVIDLRLAERLVVRLSPQGRLLGLAGEEETSL